MPTSSLDADFIITDPEIAEQFLYDIENAKPIVWPRRDPEEQERKEKALIDKLREEWS